MGEELWPRTTNTNRVVRGSMARVRLAGLRKIEFGRSSQVHYYVDSGVRLRWKFRSEKLGSAHESGELSVAGLSREWEKGSSSLRQVNSADLSEPPQARGQ